MKLLAAMSTIDEKIEKRKHPADNDEEPAAKEHLKGKTGIREVDELNQKLDGLDHGEKRLQKEMEAVKREMLELTKKYKKSTVSLCQRVSGKADRKDDNKPIISEVFNYVADMKAAPGSAATKAKTRTVMQEALAHEDEGLGPMSMLLGFGAVLLLALTVVKRYRSRSGGTKKGKRF
jgi:hypothetical protein